MRQTLELVLAGACFAAGLACCAGSWRTMLAARIGMGGAVARYGVGSLTNTFLPGRAGDAVRVGLFGRVTPGGVLAVAGAVAAVGAVRWLALVPLGIVGAMSSTLPPLAVAGWVCGTLVARLGGVTLAGSALGIPHPLAAALLVVPALELAGVVPLTPANVGIAGGAAAVAFHAQGVPMHAALAAGLGVHAVETVAAVVVGGTSALSLARSGVRILPRRWSPFRHRSFPDPFPM